VQSAACPPDLSSQTYLPTMIIGENVLANFDLEELKPFLKELGLR